MRIKFICFVNFLEKYNFSPLTVTSSPDEHASQPINKDADEEGKQTAKNPTDGDEYDHEDGNDEDEGDYDDNVNYDDKTDDDVFVIGENKERVIPTETPRALAGQERSVVTENVRIAGVSLSFRKKLNELFPSRSFIPRLKTSHQRWASMETSPSETNSTSSHGDISQPSSISFCSILVHVRFQGKRTRRRRERR